MFPRSTGKAITRLALRASLRAFIIFSLPLARNRVNPGGKFSVDSIFSLYALYINFYVRFTCLVKKFQLAEGEVAFQEFRATASTISTAERSNDPPSLPSVVNHACNEFD